MKEEGKKKNPGMRSKEEVKKVRPKCKEDFIGGENK